MRSLRGQPTFILSAVSSAALLLWMIMMPADIAAVLVVFVATVIILFIVATYISMSRTSTATKSEPTRGLRTRRIALARRRMMSLIGSKWTQRSATDSSRSWG